jgi:replicative DNA helicase
MQNSKNIEAVKVEKTKIINLERGLMPPQAIDLECAVLGGMLIDRKGRDEAMMILKDPAVFYKEHHSQIFTAIKSLYDEGSDVDLLTVDRRLDRMGVRDSIPHGYLVELSMSITSSAHIETHCRLLLQYHLKRMIIAVNSQMIAEAYNEQNDVFELIENWQKQFDKIADVTTIGRQTQSFIQALDKLQDNIELLSSNKEDVVMQGVRTGLKRIDKYTGGYRNQDLVIIAARPGMGKTSLILKTAIENAKAGVAVGIVSLEMSMEQMTARMVAIDTRFHLTQLIKRGFEDKKYFTTFIEHKHRMAQYPILIDDTGNSELTDLVILAKFWKRKYDIGVLIIDYIQLMEDKSFKGNREGEVSSISRRLKKLAKELDIPVIALSQLSRQCETRGGQKRPLLIDLRESGAIEQDADIVQFIYRPEYYKLEMPVEEYADDRDDVKLIPLVEKGANTEIIFAKYRGGSVGKTVVMWEGNKTKFIDVEDSNDFVQYEEVPADSIKPMTAEEAFGKPDEDDQTPF